MNFNLEFKKELRIIKITGIIIKKSQLIELINQKEFSLP